VLQNETLLLILFNAVIIALLALDLGVFHRRLHAVSMKEAAIWSTVWVTLSLLFNAFLFYRAGAVTGMEFLAGYLIEKSLSVDNIFVFLVIFTYFGVPAKYQHKILFWGVLGALVMRSLFILAGTTLIARFEWILYIFGMVLVVSGWRLMFQEDVEVHPEKNIFIRMAKRLFPVTTDFDSPRFLVRREHRTYLTPMLLVLITIETTDVVFAFDSIPAVFSVTRDPFIVYSSNVCAILGLRAMYFLLAGAMTSFYYLNRGLSIVLIFIGVKMLIEKIVPISIGVSLSVVATILAAAIIASLLRNRRLARKESAHAGSSRGVAS
jgi:tellurite resistance protein TerC